MKPQITAIILLLGLVLAQPAPIPIRFSELYSAFTAKGLEMSPKLLEATGKRIEMLGYMAPPLKPRLEFFVLTRTALATCPFCSSAADWPPDIVLVIMPKGRFASSSIQPLRVRGRLEVGVKEDPETGFVSLIRIYADDIEEVKL